MTGLDLISAALRLIGVLASGESPSASEATDGLSSLNDMIDSWSNENLLIPSKVREVFPLVVGQQTYTWGTGGNFNSPRPQKIEQALIQIVAYTPPLELPMKILNQEQFAGILLKTLTSTYPMYIYCDNAYPLANVNVWPVPGQGDNLVFYSWKPLTEIATLTTQISLPPGYQRALRYALAVELAPEYGRAVSPAVSETADVAVASIKRMNWQPNYLRVDNALIPLPSVWNWMTGEPT